MKRTLSIVLALVMLLAMFATVGAAEGPEAGEPAEATEEPLVTEEPAPEVPAEPETAGPETAGPETTEPVEEPAEPTGEPEPVSEPEQTDAPESEPAPEPAVSGPSAEEPASNETAPVSAPESTPEVRTVKVHAGAGVFPAPRAAYSELTVTLQEGALPDTSALAEEKGWYEPTRAGYRFAGWSTTDTAGAVTGNMLHEKDAVPEDKTELWPCWKRVVVLDAAPGSFIGPYADGYQNYTRTVELDGDKLPTVLEEEPVYDYLKPKEAQLVKFVGWFTKKTVMTHAPGGEDDAAWWEWQISTDGDMIAPGSPVPGDVTVLYAGYEIDEEAARETTQKVVTYYYDWNGINGMYGHCMTSSRAYDEAAGGYRLSYEDLLIRYLNWDDPKMTFDSMQAAQAYWDAKNADGGFDGYKFLGWATEQDAEKPNVTDGTVIANGQSIYAVWEKGEMNNRNFVRPTPGPLETLRFDGLRVRTHASVAAEASVLLFSTPVDAELADITWTLSYGVPREDAPAAPPRTVTGTVTEGGEPYQGPGFTATADGRVLTIVNTDGQDHAVSISATARPVQDGVTADTVVSTPADAPAVVSFSHSWDIVRNWEPTCDTEGQRTLTCLDCGKVVVEPIPADGHRFTYKTTPATCTADGRQERYCVVCGRDEVDTLPATGHQYKVTSVKMQGVMRITNEVCTACGDKEVLEEDTSIIKGDVNGDKTVNTMDVLHLYKYVTKQIGNMVKMAAGDVNGDSATDTMDLLRLYKFVTHQIPSL